MPTSTSGVFFISGSMLISFSSSGRLANTAAAQNSAITTMVVTMWAM